MSESTGRDERQVARWDPFSDLDFFESFRPFRDWTGLGARLPRLAEERMPVPAVEVHDSEEAYVITAEIPGVQKEDVQVECHEGVLTLRGEKRSERDESKEQRRWTERSYGAFSRSFRLPRDADPDRIEARFRDGVLMVTVSRAEKAKPRQVNIRA